MCIPCCLRGEPEEKRLELTDDLKSPKYAEEKVGLLETDEKLPLNNAGDDETTAVKRGVEVISKPNHKYNEDNKDNSEEGEPEEKRLEVTDDVPHTPKHAEEKVGLLETDQQLQNTVSDDETTAVKPSVEVISAPKHNYKEENTDNSFERKTFADKNGTQARHLANKTVRIILVSKTQKESLPSVTDLPARQRPNEEEGKQVESKSYLIREKEVPSQFESKPRAVTDRQEIITEMKGQPISRREIQVSEKRSTASFGGGSRGNSYTSVHQRSVVTKTIGGREGTTENRAVQSSMKYSGQGSEDPIIVIKKQRDQVDLPEWLEEGRPAQENSPAKLHSETGVHLKYPRSYVPKKVTLNDKAREVPIKAEVSKRGKPDISMLSLEQVLKEEEKAKKVHKKEEAAAPADKTTQPDEEEEEEEEEDDDYDDFEEEIVVLEIRRPQRFHRQLEIPRREPPKVGVPIEDLLVLPQVQKQQETTPKNFLVDEKIEAVERVSVEFAMPDLDGVLKNL